MQWDLVNYPESRAANVRARYAQHATVDGGWLMIRLERPSATLTEALRQHARAMPDRPALRFLPAAGAELNLTFAELDLAAAKAASLLRSRVRAGDRILM